MKYLHIHTAIWFVLCVALVVILLAIYVVYNLIYFIWAFKFDPWSNMMERSVLYMYTDENNEIQLGSRIECDRTPVETFKYYFNYFNCFQQ